MTELIASTLDPVSPPTGAPGPIAIQEAVLRQLAATDPDFVLFVFPLVESKTLFWRLVIRFSDNTQELRLVDARLRDRRWKQLNALARFICRCCGGERRMNIDLAGVNPDLLTTKGE